MKRGWAALVMILAAIGLSVGETLYLNSSIPVCVEMLNEADEHMEKNEIPEAQSLAQRVDHRFGTEADLMEILLYRGEVAEVSKGLAELRRYAQRGSTADFLAVSARVKRALLSMMNSRALSLGNIL